MNRLKELRNEKKLTQQELADIAKVSKRTYIYWENGESQIKPDKAQILADFFGVSVGYLLGYSGDKTDFPFSFDSPESFEKAKVEIFEKLQNNDTKELTSSYSGEELTGIIEKSSSKYDKEKDFLDQFFQLDEQDKGIIRYLTENLAKNKL